ncbi:hypothetical protein [Poriferisphaera sp. WC338]|uniref:hypothetical protein n=1 Tax=Poriferisphaera sp. WC338 TaxID=3425129 RepID=UPI003D81ACCE
MNLYTLTVGIICAILQGTSITLLCWPLRKPFLQNNWLLIFSLAITLSYATGGALLFYVLILLDNDPGISINLDTVFTIILTACAFIRCRKLIAAQQTNLPDNPTAVFQFTPSTKILSSLLAILCIYTLYGLHQQFQTTPIGYWDSWTMWHLKPQAIYWLPDPLTYIAQESSHGDYPLLQSLLIARLWFYADYDSILIFHGLSYLNLIIIPALIIGYLAQTKNLSTALIAGFTCFASPVLINQSGWLYADITLSLTMTATLIMLLLAVKDRFTSTPLLFLFGMMCAIPAGIKNEGIAFSFFITIAFLTTAAIVLPVKHAFKSSTIYALGLLPIGLTTLYFKAAYTPESDILHNRDFSTIADTLFDSSRYQIILQTLSKYFTFAYSLPLLIAIVLLLIFAGIDRRKHHLLPSILCLFIFIAMPTTYFLIYLTSSNDLTWYVNSSMPRLMLQLYPLGILTFFTIIKPLSMHNTKSAEASTSLQTTH